jgi:hypothetical protein
MLTGSVYLCHIAYNAAGLIEFPLEVVELMFGLHAKSASVIATRQNMIKPTPKKFDLAQTR